MDNNSLEILFKLEIIFYKVDTTSVDTLLELDKLVILFLILLIKVFAVLMNREETYKECSECGERHYDYDYSEESFKNLNCCEGATVEEETD